MDTRDDPNASNDPANHVLRYGSEASRRCLGISATGHAELIYLLGSYRTWIGAAAVLRAPDIDKALAAVMETSDRTATSLMKTLRAYASQCPVQQITAPEQDEDLRDPMKIEMEILSQEDWLSSADTHDGRTKRSIADAAAGLTPAQVYSHLHDFSDDVPGYWLLGRLEASTGLQAALALAVVSGRDTRQRVAQLRTAIALQCEASRNSLQPMVDTINTTHQFLHATCETLFVEGLDAKTPRLIVVNDDPHSSHDLSHPG